MSKSSKRAKKAQRGERQKAHADLICDAYEHALFLKPPSVNKGWMAARFVCALIGTDTLNDAQLESGLGYLRETGLFNFKEENDLLLMRRNAPLEALAKQAE